MNFREYILNEELSNLHYEPPKDVRTLIYDFYLFSSLYNRTKHEFNPNPDKQNGIMNLGSNFSTENEPDYDDKLTYILNHEIGNKLIPYLRQHLLDCLFYSTCCEVRHFFNEFYDNERINYKNNNKEFYEFISKLKEEEEEELTRENAFNYFKDSGISPYKLVSEFKKIFELKGWHHKYGGEPWANICKAYLDLYNAKNFNQQLIQIDHVYDLQHNTGFALNKVEDYSNDDEIKNILDHKKYIKSLYELVEFVSPSFKNLALRLIKSKFGTSYQHHLDNYEKDYDTVFNYARMFRLMKNPSEKVKLIANQLNMVKNDPSSIQFIKNPSESVQLATVEKDGYAICYIENPSEKVQIAAVSQTGRAIGYINNPSETVKFAAVRENGNAIKFIENPSEEMKLAAVQQNGYAIESIENPSEEIKLAAVQQNGYTIRYIENPSEEIQLAAVQQDPNSIQYIENPSETVQLAAVQQYGYAIQHIKKPSEKIKLAAVQQNGYAILYIKYPSEAVQLAAVQKNKNAIEFIQNPSERVKLIAQQTK